MKFIKLSNAAQDGSIYIDPDFIGMISRNRDADTFIRFKDGSYAHVLEMPNEVVEMISGPSEEKMAAIYKAALKEVDKFNPNKDINWMGQL